MNDLEKLKYAGVTWAAGLALAYLAGIVSHGVGIFLGVSAFGLGIIAAFLTADGIWGIDF